MINIHVSANLLLKFKAIHHFLPVLARYDAIGETVLRMQKISKEFGYESEIFVEKPIDQTSKITKKYKEYKKHPKDLVIYHHSIGSILSEYAAKLDVPKILFYHNVTPPSFFESFDKTISTLLYQGRMEIKKLSKNFDYAMAASSYNRSELIQFGYKFVLPVNYFIDLKRFDKFPTNPKILKQFQDTTNIIFVGRRSPNKKIEDILKVFAFFRIFNPKSKLFLLGGSWSVENYRNMINELVQELHLQNDVVFIDILSDAELASYYRISDIFLCMSEHEGFCIPLVEAMFFKIPIVSFNSSAIPDTLGDSGILINHKNYSEVAQLLHIINNSENIKETIRSKQSSRLELFSDEKSIDSFKEIIKHLEEKFSS